MMVPKPTSDVEAGRPFLCRQSPDGEKQGGSWHGENSPIFMSVGLAWIFISFFFLFGDAPKHQTRKMLFIVEKSVAFFVKKEFNEVYFWLLCEAKQ